MRNSTVALMIAIALAHGSLVPDSRAEQEPSQMVPQLSPVPGSVSLKTYEAPVTGSKIQLYRERFSVQSEGQTREIILKITFGSKSRCFSWHWGEAKENVNEKQTEDWLARVAVADTEDRLLYITLKPPGSIRILTDEARAVDIHEARKKALSAYPARSRARKDVFRSIADVLGRRFFMKNPFDVLQTIADATISKVERVEGGWKLSLAGADGRRAVVTLNDEFEIQNIIADGVTVFAKEMRVLPFHVEDDTFWMCREQIEVPATDYVLLVPKASHRQDPKVYPHIIEEFTGALARYLLPDFAPTRELVGMHIILAPDRTTRTEKRHEDVAFFPVRFDKHHLLLTQTFDRSIFIVWRETRKELRSEADASDSVIEFMNQYFRWAPAKGQLLVKKSKPDGYELGLKPDTRPPSPFAGMLGYASPAYICLVFDKRELDADTPLSTLAPHQWFEKNKQP